MAGDKVSIGEGEGWCLIVAVGWCLKILLWPSYRSTDFDVHRNWLAVTYSRKVADWYGDGATPIDYPVLFACMEWLIAQFAVHIDSTLIEEGTWEPNWSGIAFHRASVISTEFLGLFIWYRLGAPWFIGLASLLIVDHIHFQYNGILLGSLGLWLLLAQDKKIAPQFTAIAFAFLINFKHLFLSLAPVAAFQLLGATLLKNKHAVYSFFSTVIIGGFATLIPTLAFAFFASDQPLSVLSLIFSRLFPFEARGLVHALWAPNLWALYLFLDRFLILATGTSKQISSSSTRGLVDSSSGGADFLPTPGAASCVALSLLAMTPGLLAAFLSQGNKVQDDTLFLPAVFHCALSAFLFGYHVHEKFLLIALLPLALISTRQTQFLGTKSQYIFRRLASLTTFILCPLLPDAYLIAKITLLLTEDSVLQLILPSSSTKQLGPIVRLFDFFHHLVLALLLSFQHIIHPYLLPAHISLRFEFLPLMLISVYCALCVLGLWLFSSFDLSRALLRRRYRPQMSQHAKIT